MAVDRQQIVTEADLALVGVETAPGYHLIEAGAVRRFCDAVGIDDPVYFDLAAARAAGYPERPVPAVYWCAIDAPGSDLVRPTLGGFGHRNVNGGTEYEYLRPAWVGQTVACIERIAGIEEREGRHGPMVVVVYETIWLDSAGEVLTRGRLRGIRI